MSPLPTRQRMRAHVAVRKTRAPGTACGHQRARARAGTHAHCDTSEDSAPSVQRAGRPERILIVTETRSLERAMAGVDLPQVPDHG